MEKPIQDFSLHTHSAGFDGRNAPSEMVARACEIGMTSFGISNHFIVHPNITKSRFYPHAVSGGYSAIYSSSFDEAIAKFKPHYEELARLSDACGIKLYRGMELDYFDTPDWMRGVEKVIKTLHPDYIICASHFVEYDGMLCNVHDIANAKHNAYNEMLQLYWEKIGRAAKTGVFNWMAHLDLPKKMLCGSGALWIPFEQKAIDAIAQSKTPIEINTSFYDRNQNQPYPSARILQMAAAANVPVLLSDDAHRAEQIGRHFGRAYDFAKSCGINNFLTVQDAIHSR